MVESVDDEKVNILYIRSRVYWFVAFFRGLKGGNKTVDSGICRMRSIVC